VQPTLAGSARPCGLLALPKQLPVHRDEQLLAVLPEPLVSTDRLYHIEAHLIVSTGDGQVAEQPRQCAGLQLQGAFQRRNLCGDGKRSAAFPLRDGVGAHAGNPAERSLGQAPQQPRLVKNAAELSLLLCGRHALVPLVIDADTGSIAHDSTTALARLCVSSQLLPLMLTMLYGLVTVPRPQERCDD
jgi:hypothetical protein